MSKIRFLQLYPACSVCGHRKSSLITSKYFSINQTKNQVNKFFRKDCRHANKIINGENLATASEKTENEIISDSGDGIENIIYPKFITLKIDTQKIHDIKIVSGLNGKPALEFNSEKNALSLHAVFNFSTNSGAVDMMAEIFHQIFHPITPAQMVADAKGGN